jgi:hypothetical protein
MNLRSILRYGRRNGLREKVRGEYRFEFARGGEGVGRGEYGFEFAHGGEGEGKRGVWV